MAGREALTLREYGRLPADERTLVDQHLLANRIGYWMWDLIEFDRLVWWVHLWQSAPQGGPLWGVGPDTGRAEPLFYWRGIPWPGTGP